MLTALATTRPRIAREVNLTAAPTGRITGGTREFKGATGSFTVLDLHYTSNDPAKQAGRWKGSIRY